MTSHPRIPKRRAALHGCVIGVAQEKKALAVSGDRKIDSLMQFIGLNDWVCNNKKLDELPALLEKIDEQAESGERVSALRSKNREVARDLHALLAAIKIT